MDTDAHTEGKTPPKEWSTCFRSCCIHNMKQTKETNNHALSWKRTLNPSNQGALDPTLNCTATGTGFFFHCYIQFIWKLYLFYSVFRSCQTPTKHTKNICEPPQVISVKHSSVLPDDGSRTIRNMLGW